ESTSDSGKKFDIWKLIFLWSKTKLLSKKKKLRPTRIRSATKIKTAIPLSRSENGERGRRAARQPGKRQAAGGRPVVDAHAQHAVRAARSHHRSQPRGRTVLHPRGQGRARNRRHDAPARSRIFRCGAGRPANHARGFAADRPP